MKKVIRTVLKITLTTVVLICALAFPHMNALAWDVKTVDVVKADDTHYTVSCRIPYSEAHVTEQNSYLSIYQFTILSGYKTIVDSSDSTNYLTHLDGSHHIELSQNDGTGIVIVFLSVAQDYSYHIPVGTYTNEYLVADQNNIHYTLSLEVYDDTSKPDDNNNNSGTDTNTDTSVNNSTGNNDSDNNSNESSTDSETSTPDNASAAAFLSSSLDTITNTPQNMPVNITTKDYWCFNSNIIKSIASRTSGNVTVDFWYDKMHYKMTIPAGTDFSRYLTGPGNGFIGFMKIYSLVGGSLIETAD